MAHRVDIRFRQPITGDDAHTHKVKNFIEDVWASAWRNGWVDLKSLDQHVNAMKDFGFTFPGRQSHEALNLVTTLVRDHFMDQVVDVIHTKKAPADG